MNTPWRCLGFVDVSALTKWVREARPHWPALPCDWKPQRIEGPADLVRPVVDRALELLGGHGLAEHRPVLSRMAPGQTHPMHADRQRSDWLTRIHVPLLTNEGAWMAWEDHGSPVHFVVGKAYTFDTLQRHAFGNAGETERIHLMFDVLRRAAA
jgi:hypothetical protein